MSTEFAANYSSYLKVPELLDLQHPLSSEHDELLFIVIHQSYELWFKEMIHEFKAAQKALEMGETHRTLAILGRIRTILKICVSQVDILETMTPLQFNSFRDRLGASSGFQSAQFREVEAILGRRDERAAIHLLPADRARVESHMTSPSIWDSVLKYVTHRALPFLTIFSIAMSALPINPIHESKVHLLNCIAMIQKRAWSANDSLISMKGFKSGAIAM